MKTITASVQNGALNPMALAHALGVSAIVVPPSQACVLLSIGTTRLYELLNAGELESFKDGKSRKITVNSIHAYIERKMAAAQ